MENAIVEIDEKKTHSDVLLFNRWSYDDVQVFLCPLISVIPNLITFIFLLLFSWLGGYTFTIVSFSCFCYFA